MTAKTIIEFVILTYAPEGYEQEAWDTAFQAALDERPCVYTDDLSDLDITAQWAVRAPFKGEAEGTYQRMPGGCLQILGYTIPVPDAVQDHVKAAFERAHQILG